MASLWTKTGTTPPRWAVLDLDRAPQWDLCQVPPRPIEERDDTEIDVALQRLTGERWLLLHHRGVEVRVNGWRVPSGIRCLSDRDELGVPGQTGSLFLSLERRAVVEPYSGKGARVSCPRCHQSIEAGAAVARCTFCSVAYHMDDEYPCFVHGERCVRCDNPTRFDDGFRWTPEDL